MDKLTLMGRYPEVLAALNEARKAAGVPIPKAASLATVAPRDPKSLRNSIKNL
ncbi:hypothetical protein PTT_16625 [Pyrenophora teres f. teres 0-1]|uniref:Uncharacterized protein n=1 Tax=Pyrenophora teres f. teres (strain 0-1) TaxID=861557 RepID=E3S2Q2_PYRTT|nr:hypothetical protein PTT_16625 [Pyrenophora teres f. teres 0-1]